MIAENAQPDAARPLSTPSQPSPYSEDRRYCADRTIQARLLASKWLITTRSTSTTSMLDFFDLTKWNTLSESYHPEHRVADAERKRADVFALCAPID